MLLDPVLLGRTDRRDPRGQLHVVDVVERKLLAAQVQVQVDHPRHDEEVLALDDPVALHPRRVVPVVLAHLRDHVAGDQDVVGPARRPAVARDDHDVA